MSRVRMLRNTLLPPPLLIIGLAILGYAIWPSAKNSPGKSAAAQIATPVDRLESPEARFLEPAPLLVPTDAIKTIAEKPLFLEGRRPWIDIIEETGPPVDLPPPPEPEVVAPPPVPTAPPQPEIRLLGMVTGDGMQRALILQEDNQTERWVSIGADLSGWQVDEITANQLVLRAGDEEIVVTYNR